MLSQIRDYYPGELRSNKIKKYFEPFLGGGAVFFDIIKNYNIKSAYLTDINEELILVYLVIQRNPVDLIEYLESYEKKYKALSEDERKKYYYEMRSNLNQQRFQINYKKYSENWDSRAAQLIFLNKTCFNGLFRVNQSGKFNVPFGKYKNPKILDEKNILAVSKALQNAEIFAGNFTTIENSIDSNSFVYFDPPYRPISSTSSFTSYSKNNFDDSEQVELGTFYKKLDSEKKPKLMLSNSDPTNVNPEDTFFNDLYDGFNINKVNAKRMINCNGKRRGEITEILVTNYQ